MRTQKTTNVIRKTAVGLVCGAMAMLGVSNAQAESVLIANATIHTMGESGTLKKASILIEDGEITAIGSNVDVPRNVTTIDAEGKVITPGLFDAFSTLGLAEVSSVDATVDNSQEGKYGPAFRVADAFNPRSQVIVANRIEGVSRALLAPRVGDGGHVIAGMMSVVHLGGTEDPVEISDAAMMVYLGAYGGDLSGGSRAAALLRLREALGDAEDYRDGRDEYDQGDSRQYSLSKLDMEALQPVLAGRVPMLVAVDRAADITAVLKLADEFAVKTVLIGAAEAWMVADAIADADVPVLVDPLQNLPDQFESMNSRLDNAVKLHDAGIEIGFYTNGSHNARNMTQSAGNAVANGLPWDAALRAITAGPAGMFGADEDCCALEPGNPADLVVWDGDPLEVTTFADHVFVGGKAVDMTSRQTRLRDRYLDLSGELPFAYRK